MRPPNLQQLTEWDLALCLSCNRWGRFRPVTQVFSLFSRLGNGMFWYVLMAVLATAQGTPGRMAALHMALTGLASLLVYKVLKERTGRPRPFVIHNHVRQRTLTLDRFSFPSGHTQHAVGFTVVALHYYPELAVLLLPFTLLVSLSRPILGLHYPSDVMAGALLGYAVAQLGFML